MCNIVKNGVIIETPAIMTAKMMKLFSTQLSQYDRFENAFITINPCFCGPTWVIKARKANTTAYAVIEGYDKNGIRAAYFYSGNMAFEQSAIFGKTFTTAGWEAMALLDGNSNPCLHWKQKE